MSEEQVGVLTRGDMVKPGALEKFQERGAIGGVEISMGVQRGGMRFENMMQIMEFAKMMAMADIAVPEHLRGNPGACLAVTIQADEWGFSPFAVANKSYSVNKRMAYESQLIHAVIERRAPLDGRLRMELRGEGPTRRCKVIGRLIGEAEPFVWEGPEFQQIKVKNSPEWTANTDKQLWYHASRDWARIYCPDVLLGVYTRDELDNTELGPSRAREISDITSRLPETREGGFDADGIATTLASARIEQGQPAGTDQPAETEVTTEAAKPGKPPRGKKTTEKAAEPDPEQQAIDHDPATGEVIEEAAPGEAALASNSEPQTKEEYTAYAENWISRIKDKDDAEARWDGERELRGKCKVAVTERKRLERLLNEKIS